MDTSLTISSPEELKKIRDFPYLTHLSLAGLGITSIQGFGFGGLHLLTFLDVSRNNLQRFPSLPLHNLRILLISENPFKKCTLVLPLSLRRLEARGCRFGKAHNSIEWGRAKLLSHLDLEDNPYSLSLLLSPNITHLKMSYGAISGFRSARNLQWCDVGNARLLDFPTPEDNPKLVEFYSTSPLPLLIHFPLLRKVRVARGDPFLPFWDGEILGGPPEGLQRPTFSPGNFKEWPFRLRRRLFLLTLLLSPFLGRDHIPAFLSFFVESLKE